MIIYTKEQAAQWRKDNPDGCISNEYGHYYTHPYHHYEFHYGTQVELGADSEYRCVHCGKSRDGNSWRW